METLKDYPGGYNYKGLQEIENTLHWCEENLRAPQINSLEGFGIGTQPPDSTENLRNMRLITTLGLTHSDGYVLYNMGLTDVDYGLPHHAHIWYDFWDADLGKPVGEKAQLYENREGLFIREFTNGWAVYNRSGKAQKIQLPIQATGVASGITSATHIVPDLDGEMYLKQEASTNSVGAVEVLDFTTVDPQAASEWMPDAALRAAVLEELGLPADVPLTKDKMLVLTRLYQINGNYLIFRVVGAVSQQIPNTYLALIHHTIEVNLRK